MLKYVISSLPLGLCGSIAAVYAFMAATNRQGAIDGLELTTTGAENSAIIFAFAGYVFTQMAWIYCLYVDWLAWDDRRQLQRVLDEEEKGK